MKDLSIIIVSYNTEALLQECLSSVFSAISKQISFEVIVVDNDSKDGSVEMVKKEFPQVVIIENKENMGFSKANNVGIKASFGKFVLFLNSDTVMKEYTIEVLLEFMEKHPHTGACTCKLVMPNGQMDDACHRGFPTPWNAFSHFIGLSKIFPFTTLFGGYNLTYLNMNTVHEVDALAGAFMLVRREAGEQVGWWDEDYFFYGEDLDFCYLLKQNGWKIFFIPSVTVLHYKGVSGGIKKVSKEITTADKKTKRKVTKARFNAMRIFYKKHYMNTYPKIVTNLVLTGVSLKEWVTLRSL